MCQSGQLVLVEIRFEGTLTLAQKFLHPRSHNLSDPSQPVGDPKRWPSAREDHAPQLAPEFGLILSLSVSCLVTCSGAVMPPALVGATGDSSWVRAGAGPPALTATDSSSSLGEPGSRPYAKAPRPKTVGMQEYYLESLIGRYPSPHPHIPLSTVK